MRRTLNRRRVAYAVMPGLGLGGQVRQRAAACVSLVSLVEAAQKTPDPAREPDRVG